MPVVSISMPDALLEELDALADDHDYSGRSEVVREATRSLLTEFDDDRPDESPIVGVITIQYAFGTRSVERRLTELKREYDDRLVTTDHSHVDDDCLEVLLVESGLDGVSELVSHCRSIDDIDQVAYSIVPLELDRSQ